MLRKVAIGLVLVTWISTHAVSQDYQKVVPQTDSRTTTKEKDREAWKAKMKIALANDPRGYEVLRGVYLESTQRKRQQYLNIERRRREAFITARNTNTRYLNTYSSISTATPGIKLEVKLGEISKLQSSDNELYEFNKSENDRKYHLSKEISANPDVLERMLDYYSLIEYNTKTFDSETKALIDTLNDVRSNRTDMPQGPLSRKQILETSNNPADIKALLDSDKPQSNIFVQNVLNLNKFKFNSYKSSSTPIDQRINQVAALLKDPKLSPQQRRDVKRHLNTLNQRQELIHLELHQANVAKLKETQFLLQEATALLFSQDVNVQKAVQLYSGGVKLYNALGNMAITGITTGGISLFFSGLNIVSGLNGSGPNTDQQILKMLAEIRKTLTEIQKTQTYQSIQLDNIIDSVNALEQKNVARFRELRKLVIEGNEKSTRLIKQSFTDVSIDLTTRPLNGILDSINRNHPNYDGSIRSAYLKCMIDNKKCSDRTMKRIEDIVDYTGQIYKLVTSDLPLKPYTNENRKVTDFSSKAQVDGFMAQHRVDDRLGEMLKSMFVWLDTHYSEELRKAKEKSANKKVSEKDLILNYVANSYFEHFFHWDGQEIILPDLNTVGVEKIVSPSLITQRLIPEYKNAVAVLPLKQGRHGDTRHVFQMQAIVDNIKGLSSRMRQNVPLAAAIFFDKIMKLEDHIRKIQKRWEYPKAYFNRDKLEKIQKYLRRGAEYTYAKTKPFVPGLDISTPNKLSSEESIFFKFLIQLGITHDVKEGSKGLVEEVRVYRLTPSAKRIYDKMVAQNRINAVPDLNNGFHKYVKPLFGNKPAYIYVSSSEKITQNMINAKIAAMQVALEAIQKKRQEHVQSAVKQLQNSFFKEILKEISISKLILNTLVLGGYGECAFKDKATEPYSFNLLELSSRVYSNIEKLEKFTSNDDYNEFLKLGPNLTNIIIKTGDLYENTFNLEKYHEKINSCILGLGNVRMANQMLKDIRLMDPAYKIPTLEY